MDTRAHTIIEGETGFVIKAKEYLITLEGLPSARVDTVIVNQKGERALVTALREDSVEAYLLDRGTPKAGDQFVIDTRGIQFSFGEHLYGRALNVLGEPIDGLGGFPESTVPLRMQADAPSMNARAELSEQLMTGMPAVDVLIPIAKGQRQLVIGPISSGKTVFLESVLARQRGSEVICIYAFIGRPIGYIEDVTAHLMSEHGNNKSIILASYSNDSAPRIYLTPIVSLELAEYFSWEGRDVLLVLDDLGTHAKYFREIALLSGEVPGRESYAGDMFYQQARLLERGGRFNKTVGGGSITILPVLETNIEDMTNLVSTNMVSATDGHLFFSPTLYAEGHFPATVPQQSVTRVGHKVQNNLTKQLAIRVHALIAEYERQKRYSQFGTQLSEQTRGLIKQGESLQVFLDQESTAARSLEVQVILLALVFTKLGEGTDADYVKRNREVLASAISSDPELEPLRASVRRGTVSLEQFLRKVESAVPRLQSLCQPH